MSASHATLPFIQQVLAGGKKFFEEKKYTEALQCYSVAIEIDNDNVEALTGRYKVYQKMGPRYSIQANADLNAALCSKVQEKVKLLHKESEREQKAQDYEDKLNFIKRYVGLFQSEQTFLSKNTSISFQASVPTFFSDLPP